MRRAFSEFDKEIGARIKACRRMARMSQAALARHLGVTFQQVAKYETGENRMSAGLIVEAAHAVGVTPSSLIDNLQPSANLPKVETIGAGS